MCSTTMVLCCVHSTLVMNSCHRVVSNRLKKTVLKGIWLKHTVQDWRKEQRISYRLSYAGAREGRGVTWVMTELRRQMELLCLMLMRNRGLEEYCFYSLSVVVRNMRAAGMVWHEQWSQAQRINQSSKIPRSQFDWTCWLSLIHGGLTLQPSGFKVSASNTVLLYTTAHPQRSCFNR